MDQLRLLALHGYHGSADTLRMQLAPLATAIAPLAEIVYVDAPSLAADDFGWWHSVADRDAPTEQDRARYRGWSRTRDHLLALCRDRGPFDGVLGFSQGAALAALLVAPCAADPAGAGHARFDCAILVGGFASRDPRHAALFEVPGGIAVPSLHVIGRSDAIVSPGASRALAARFAAPVVVEHEGGHVIADTREVRAAVHRFLEDAARRRAGRPGSRSAASPAPSPSRTAAVAPPRELPLWPGRAHPAMRIFVPSGERRPRPALIVLRGGGYARCDGSGAGSAEWAARHGMVGIEVDYATRSTGESHPAAFADAARAVRLARHHAAAWGIDPGRVGVLGYSAGGHLASLLSTQPALYASPDDDLAPRISARPDLVVLGYPLISFVDGYRPGAFFGSVENFFGRSDGLDEALRREFSSELHVAPGHPPVFLWTTADDDIVPASHSERFAAACRRAGVALDFTVYPHGPHAMGLALDRPGEVGRWTERLRIWLTERWGPL